MGAENMKPNEEARRILRNFEIMLAKHKRREKYPLRMMATIRSLHRKNTCRHEVTELIDVPQSESRGLAIDAEQELRCMEKACRELLGLVR